MALPKAPVRAPKEDPLRLNNTGNNKQNVIGKNLISGLLTVLRRPVYASDQGVEGEDTDELSLQTRSEASILGNCG